MSCPSLYEYYTSNGITEGLSTKYRDYFTLNHRPIQIFSGAIHYFRVPPQYWRDRLRKSRAAGLNCIETYIAWNLHQPNIDNFDFGDGNSDFSQFLNIAEFFKIAQEEDLFVIVRPGPYICAEWEFGGLPPWLLRYDLKIRTHNPEFIKFVRDYFKVLLSILAPLQFTKGGPIILFQIENEYGDTKIDDKPIDTRYLSILKEILEDQGIVELFCTCGTPSQGFFGSLPNVLSTANFQRNPVEELTLLRNYQPDKPLLVMEYWTGWYDHWTENHHKRDLADFTQILDEIINFPASVNLYMFHGGTNWCFYNGADISDKSRDNSKFQPLTTSYDYDAPLSEAGDYTDKYYKVKELIEKYNKIKTRIPPVPPLMKRVAYPSVKITEKLTISNLIDQSKWSETSKNLKSMEFLDFNRNSGQSYGYIVYRKRDLKLPPNSILKIEGHVCDTVMVLIDGILKSPPLNSQDDLNNFGYWRLKDSTLHLNNTEEMSVTLDLIVENWGRCNYGKLDQFNQYKGLWQGGVLLNNEILENFQIIPLEFRKCWLESLIGWQIADFAETGPNLYRTIFDIGGDIGDSFVDMRGWCKGFVVVNGFVLGRYLKLGPQQSLYLPASFLRQTNNVLMIFEHFSFAKLVGFLSDPIYHTSDLSCVLTFVVLLASEMTDSYPTLYEYYTSDGIESGLSADQSNFTLNNKSITIFSGAIHYFRVPPQYWRDRLRKARAIGLNCVETYIPWNLHEPQRGVYDFGNGSSEFSQFLDIVQFIKIAQEEDLFVIIRPGPYICAEWEFGGLPSWLLRYNLKIRTSDEQYISFVRDYFNALLALLVPLQFTKGGPIIACQIENEYGNTKVENESIDTAYLETLKTILEDNGMVELFFTADTPSNGFSGTLPGVLATANFQSNANQELTLLKEFQPEKALMVMEYWSGWYDHWTESHHTVSVETFAQGFEEIVAFPASLNMYVFHGGTSWGFLNGANIEDFTTTDNSKYQPDISTYDYNAPLSEAGDYTDKYYKAKELIEKYNTIKTKTPSIPTLVERIAYSSVKLIGKLTISDLISQSTWSTTSTNLKSMEFLDINNNSGQSYGYIVYRKENLKLSANSTLKIEGHVSDTVMVLVDGILKSPPLDSQEDLDNFGCWRLNDSTLQLNNTEEITVTLDLIVENWGRVNYGKLDQFNQYKGLWQGDVLLNDVVLEDFQIVPLEFRKSWTQSLSDWKTVDLTENPCLYRAVLNIDTSDIRDTYIDMRGWGKGFVIVNGFVLGRHFKLGPQQTLYLPAPFLQQGDNELLIFEHFTAKENLDFVTDPIFETY